ncbi:hypothetical protein IPdc08_00749 [archaeon]|nr:hypothetical protein IPdc08_00749 [archaeon]
MGYCFIGDNWNISAEKVVQTEEEKYTSEYGRDGFLIKKRIYKKEVVDDLNKYIHFLEKKHLPDTIEITYRDRIPKPSNKTKIFQPISKLIDSIKYPISREDLLGKLDDLAVALEGEVEKREISLFQSVQIHRRTISYPAVKKALIEIDDPEDIRLIVDAHDLAQTRNPLEFVSGDKDICGHTEAKLIKTNTSIAGVIPLRTFY